MSHTVAAATPREMAEGSRAAVRKRASLVVGSGRVVAKVRSSSLTSRTSASAGRPVTAVRDSVTSTRTSASRSSASPFFVYAPTASTCGRGVSAATRVTVSPSRSSVKRSVPAVASQAVRQVSRSRPLASVRASIRSWRVVLPHAWRAK